MNLYLNHVSATFIASREGWSPIEFSDVTLDCRVVISGGFSSQFSCQSISFTQNETIIDGSQRYVRSGPTFDGNKVICTMTILRVESEESGLYGCCLTDKTSGLCYKHPTKILNVIPISTTSPSTVQTTSEVTASVSSDVSTTMPTTALIESIASSVDVVYNKVTTISTSNSSLSKSDNTAQVQNTPSLFHKTIWPAFLVASLSIVILVILGVRHFRKKPTEESLPENVSDATQYSSITTGKDVENG
ncbi:uncharacterized protein LOC129255487 [Lytechinus pictus]|uniref:uncharacterized protein LOC129255487 n=1 Tax=Lytechinus pictus TaxID=7653 RepID=UPI0030B9E6C9